MKYIHVILSISTFGFSTGILKANNYILDKIDEKAKKSIGWNQSFSLSLNAMTTSFQNTPGNPSGDTNTFGLKLSEKFGYFFGKSEIRNNLSLELATSRTPILPRYIKTSDSLNYEFLYLKYLDAQNKKGVYSRVKLTTSLIESNAESVEDKNYKIIEKDGSEVDITTDKLQLTEGLRPLATRASVGGFYNPINEKWLVNEWKTGVGIRKVHNKNQLAIADDESTDSIIEVNRLADSTKIGTEINGLFSGVIYKPLSYEVMLDLLIPFDENPESDGSNWENRVQEVKAGLKYSFNTYLSFDYNYTSLFDRSITDKYQISQTVLASATFKTGS